MTAEAPQVDLTSAQVGGNVTTGEITDLPSGTRNFTGLVALLPGVVYNAAADSSSDSVTINGQNGSGVVFLMDGGSNNDDLRGGSSGRAGAARRSNRSRSSRSSPTSSTPSTARPPPASSTPSPSRAPTPGTAARFGYFTDSVDDREGLLRRAAEPARSPTRRKQQWGGTIGGPIVRDKMHFFSSFERQDRDEGRSRVYPTRPDQSFTVAQETNSWNYLWRVDHQLNSSHNYSVRFLWDHQPNYNQVLGNGTHRHAEHREGQRLGVRRHLQPGDRRDQAEHPARVGGAREAEARTAALSGDRATGRWRRRRCSSSTSSTRRTPTTPTTAT